jgi:hypothetical protein
MRDFFQAQNHNYQPFFNKNHKTPPLARYDS